MKRINKTILAVLALSGVMGSWGCELPAIFSQQDGTQTGEKVEAPAADNWVVYVRQTGGFAGVNYQLIIYENGIIRFLNAYPWQGYRQDRLQAGALSEIKKLFIKNGFFWLKDRYITEGAADVFYFLIMFRQENRTHAVYTDLLEVPENLKTIAQKLIYYMRSLQEQPLTYTLDVSRDTLTIGEALNLRFTVRSQSQEPVILYFPSTQRFDFYSPEERFFWGFPVPKIWNWGFGRIFNPVTEEIVLHPGEMLTFDATWDGRDNSGNPVIGEAWVGAELLAFPGGGSALKRVVIQNQE